MLYLRRCSRCSRRRPTFSEYCHGCGASLASPEERSGLSRGRVVLMLAVLALVGTLAVSKSERYLPALSDWYARMAIGYLPESALRLAPITDDERAFYVCARSVVRQMDGESSIATFASSGTATTHELGDGRRVIESHVDESTEGGADQRILFRCTVRPEGSRWVIEALELRTIEGNPYSELAARAD